MGRGGEEIVRDVECPGRPTRTSGHLLASGSAGSLKAIAKSLRRLAETASAARTEMESGH